jgi:hypothetical protein
MHHIISDGWSLGVLLRDVDALYRAERDGGAPELPALAVQYQDYAAWQRNWLVGDTRASQLGYWERQLAAAPPLLALWAAGVARRRLRTHLRLALAAYRKAAARRREG